MYNHQHTHTHSHAFILWIFSMFTQVRYLSWCDVPPTMSQHRRQIHRVAQIKIKCPTGQNAISRQLIFYQNIRIYRERPFNSPSKFHWNILTASKISLKRQVTAHRCCYINSFHCAQAPLRVCVWLQDMPVSATAMSEFSLYNPKKVYPWHPVTD